MESTRIEQLSLFPQKQDMRRPVSVTWNLWHGCTKVSAGCKHCYMYRKDEAVGRDPSVVEKTKSFNLPVSKLRTGEYKGFYRIPSGSMIFTCFSSDFFHIDADIWRDDAWNMIRERSDCSFLIITKRPERIKDALPHDWENGWEHVTIAVTCENQNMADKRLPIYLAIPMKHYSVMIEPMLSKVDLRAYLSSGKIADVNVGGESGPEARLCDYNWVLDVHDQCLEYNVGFSYHQTGARLLKDGHEYHIRREYQHQQAKKAGLDL